jgi:toxin ParE1/3/4
VNFRIHPAAAHEHKQQVAYYENEQPGLGRRYHAAFQAAVARACEMPQRPRVTHPPNIRSVKLDVFHFNVIYREIAGVVQILAVAHHRRQPGYWLSRA